MPFFIPALDWVGAAAASLFGSGCTPKRAVHKQVKKPTRKSKSPKTPLKSSAQRDRFCKPDRYSYFLTHLEKTLSQNGGKSVTAKNYLWANRNNPFFQALLQGSNDRRELIRFIWHLAGHDQNAKSVSLYDIFYAGYHLNDVHCKRSWEARFLQDASFYSITERIRVIGEPLLDATANSQMKKQSQKLLKNLQTYLKAQPASDSSRDALPILNYYLTQKEPPIFAKLTGKTFGEFLKSDSKEKEKILQQAVQTQIPTAQQTEELFKYLTRDEAILFTKICFKKDVDGSLALFEKVALPRLKSYYDGQEHFSGESEFFPNLSQSTSYKKRQKAIDAFLGTPVQTLKKKFTAKGKTVAETTVQKYTWVGNTEVFSIDSGKAGPTTLIFAPHYHEDNPRKMFHWLKDIPLQSGRLLVIPEANRAYGLQGGDTVAMNRIFNEALTDDRIDYLIVRRVEYLMGLVEGMVGVHDALDGPYYISDLLGGTDGKVQAKGGPVGSKWVPKWVKKIRRIKTQKTEDPDERIPAQVQWQIAEASRQKMKKLSSENLWFHADLITDHHSERADNASGYMHLGLKKPSMTVEGRVGTEHGQLHAMAVYTLLLAYGHKIHSQFEDTLKNAHPTVEPSLYQGLPVTP